METDPLLAQRTLQSALACAREHRIEGQEFHTLLYMALLEGLAGDVVRSLASFDRVIDSFLRAGDQLGVRTALATLVILFEQMETTRVAATLIGASQLPSIGSSATANHLCAILGEKGFAACVAAGAAMEFPAAAVRYAREQIALALAELAGEADAP